MVRNRTIAARRRTARPATGMHGFLTRKTVPFDDAKQDNVARASLLRGQSSRWVCGLELWQPDHVGWQGVNNAPDRGLFSSVSWPIKCSAGGGRRMAVGFRHAPGVAV